MKAVLVVDIPDYIDDISKVELAYGLYFRKRFDGEPIDPTDILEYHEVYPLRPLPEKKEIITNLPQLTDSVSGKIAIAFIKGYNACLKEITGEVDYE